MKDIIAKLAALSGAPTTDKKVLADTTGKKQLTNSAPTKKPISDGAPSMKRLMEAVDEFGAYRREPAPLSPNSPEGPIGEAAPPYNLGQVFPNTKQGVLQYMQYGYDKSFLKKLDLPTCNIHSDPQVEGVWAVDSMASGFRCVIYLAGYRDPWGKKREHNDNEEGGFTLKHMISLVRSGSLTPKLMKYWEKCGSLDEGDLAKLMAEYREWNDLDEALLSGPTQPSPEPDWDEDSYGDPDSDNYCDNCGENFPMDYDSCPNCTDAVEEALGDDIMDPDWTPDDVGFGDKQEEDSIDSLPPEELFNFFKKIGAATGRSVKQVAMDRGRGSDRYWRKIMWVGEGEEQVNELSRKTLGSYVKKNTTDQQLRGMKSTIAAFNHMADTGEEVTSDNLADIVGPDEVRRDKNRVKGFNRAVDKLSQEGLGEATNHMGDHQYQTWGSWRKACIAAGATKIDPKDEDGIAYAWRGNHQIGDWGMDTEFGTVYNLAPEPTGLDEAGGQMWEVSWWVEEKSYDDRPGREYSESELVSAPTAQAAFQIIKDRPKQVGKMRYDFKVLPAKAGKSDIDEGKTNMRKNKINESDNKEKLEKLQADLKAVKGSTPGDDRNRQLIRSEIFDLKQKMKKKVTESVDVGNAGPELAKILRHFGAELKKFRENGDLDDDLYSALYDYYFDDMPYGTKKARTGDPYEWISERLDSDLNYKFGDVSDKYMASQAQKEIDGEKEYGNFDQVASMPSSMDAAPGAEGDDKYGYPGYFGQNDLNKPKTEGFGGDIMPLEGVEADSFAPEPLPGEEVITELRVEDESRITDMLSNVGLDHGLDFWFEGDEIVVIGSREAKVVTSTVGGHIQSIDGEEFRIGMKPRAAKAAPSDLDDLAAVPELMDGMFEGKVKDMDTAKKDKAYKAAAEARKKKADEKKKALKEEVTADDIEMLNMKYKAGMITYDQFRAELDGLEQTDYSMRQGEMGNPDRYDYIRSSDDDDHDYGNSLDDEEYGDEEFEESALDPDNLDMTDLDYSDVDKQDGLDFRGQADLNFQGSRPKYDGVEEGEFANSAEDPQRPSVHTSTTDMINQGNDLNRPKKSYSSRPYRGDNPMAESNQLLKQYNMMKAAITLK